MTRLHQTTLEALERRYYFGHGNVRMLTNRGRGYQNLWYLLLKAKRMAVTNIEFIAVRSTKKAA